MRIAKSRPPKSNRKTRRLRIHLSGTLGAVQFEFAPSASSWSELEEALGQQIPEQVRRRVVEIVQDYFNDQPLEPSSPFLDDALASVGKIKSNAVALRTVLQDPKSPNMEVRRIVGRHCQIPSVKPGINQLDTLSRVLTSLINACTQSHRHFSCQPGFEDGEAWASMIRRVRTLFRENSLRSGASQDDAKHGSPSKFVLFIKALQESFPDASLRRPHQSITALAKQINRVGRKRDIKK